jgi:hypothetical protein
MVKRKIDKCGNGEQIKAGLEKKRGMGPAVRGKTVFLSNHARYIH